MNTLFISLLIGNIHTGSIIMVIGGICLALSYYFTGLNITTLSFILLINIGVPLITAPVLSLALNKKHQLASMVTGIINTGRSMFSAIIGTFVGSLIAIHFCIFPITLFSLTLLCLLVSLTFYRN